MEKTRVQMDLSWFMLEERRISPKGCVRHVMKHSLTLKQCKVHFPWMPFSGQAKIHLEFTLWVLKGLTLMNRKLMMCEFLECALKRFTNDQSYFEVCMIYNYWEN